MTLSYLEGLTQADFEGSQDAELTLSLPPAPVRGGDCLHAFGLPNFYFYFYFYVTTAYGTLRANGVPLGKRTYLGDLPLIRPQ